ncbi:hydrolase [Bdellovibrio bacteriovorus]|uniref:Hydrolase n=1 Tax=Bdellovibrio bacteriovorus TaxID=959 RepID=A0A150WSX3_BDEBC|nr:hydrolase [Bdellovibrio bacteriovorus]
MNLIFLHGFLGRPSDWALVKAYLPFGDVHIYTPDYLKDPQLGPQNSFETWAENFVKWTEKVVGGTKQNILVGYSLGGRLALHALEKKPDLWKKVVLISTNPGIEDAQHEDIGRSEERQKRWLSDAYWAEEFAKSPWETVLRNWNSQPVFKGGAAEPPRVETDFSREVLSLILTQWSLAQQRNMREVIAKYVQKIHWLVGETDEKFMALTEQLKNQIRELQVDVVMGAAHRVPLDNPKGLGERINKLLK